MSPGYDPIMDGTAAPYTEFKVWHEDGEWHVMMPDGLEKVADSFENLAKIIGEEMKK